MNRRMLFAALLLAGCSAAPSSSTPVISDLTLAACASPGAMEVATFAIANAAGIGDLTLETEILAPGEATAPVESSPLTVSGGSEAMAASAQFTFNVPTNAPLGTYTVYVTVSDGSNASNTLHGTFLVN